MQGGVHFGAGASTLAESREAAVAASRAAAAGLRAPPDIVLVFATTDHVASLSLICEIAFLETGASHVIAVTAAGVLAGDRELERGPAISVLAACLPGVQCVPFAMSDLMLDPSPRPEDHAHALARLRLDQPLRAILAFVDPFSAGLEQQVAVLGEAAAGSEQKAALVGALGSAGTRAGSNRYAMNVGRVMSVSDSGGVGIAICGPIRVDAFTSQGCRAFGPNMVVTRVDGPRLLELGGRPALDVVRELCEALPESDRRLLVNDRLHLGRVINEYKDRFGRDDYVIRVIGGTDQPTRSLRVNDLPRVGQTVRLHLLDPAAAAEDLGLVLDAHSLHGPPAGILLNTCVLRGEGLFGRPHHDASMVQRAFASAVAAERRAMPGAPMGLSDTLVPLAGMQSSGEIGPAGRRSHIHAFAVTGALFRTPATD